MRTFKESLEKIYDYINDLENTYYSDLSDKDDEINELSNTVKDLEYKITDLEENIIKKFDSTLDASKILNLSRFGITNCLNKKTKTSGGFKWKFV